MPKPHHNSKHENGREKIDWKDRSFPDEADEEEPEEVRQAWEELILIQKEQDRYAGIKLDLEQDLKEVRKTAAKLEDVSFQCINAASAASLPNYYLSNSFWSRTSAT